MGYALGFSFCTLVLPSCLFLNETLFTYKKYIVGFGGHSNKRIFLYLFLFYLSVWLIQLLRWHFVWYMIRASAFKSLLELIAVVCQIYVQGAKLHVFHLFFGSVNIQNTLLCLQRFWKVCFLGVMLWTKFVMMKRWVLYKHMVNKLNSCKLRRKNLSLLFLDDSMIHLHI